MPSYRGELRLPNKHAIAATHQGAADSNEAPPRRGRGAANAEAWRGDDGSRLLACSWPRLCLALAVAASATASARTVCCGSAAAPRARAARVARPAAGSGFVPRRRPRPRRRAVLSVTGRAVLKSVVSDAHWSRTCLVACHKLLGSPFGRLDRADGVANRPNKKRPQLPVLENSLAFRTFWC